MGREHDVMTFYSLLKTLERRYRKRTLVSVDGYMEWPPRGIYFFFEEGEVRENGEPRVVRVGTHALKKGSRTSLWNRLNQHKGNIGGRHPNGGNHRGSIFRQHVGHAIIKRDSLDCPTWGVGNTAKGEVREKEYPVEVKVSAHIRAMPFLWLKIGDDPGPESLRGDIERNSIALLSNFNRPAIDPPSKEWLGKYASSSKVQLSGLWNSNHVEERYDPGFLKDIGELIEQM